MKVLIAEDDAVIAKAQKLLLEKNHFLVDLVYTGTDAWDYIQCEDYDLAILDITMPGMNGLDLLSKMRGAGFQMPVMILTAKNDIDSRVHALNLGADDYLVKPYAEREFVARVKALSRRSSSYSNVVLWCGNLKLDCNRYVLETDGNEVALTNKEYQLMELFFRHPSRQVGHIFLKP